MFPSFLRIILQPITIVMYKPSLQLQHLKLITRRALDLRSETENFKEDIRISQFCESSKYPFVIPERF